MNVEIIREREGWYFVHGSLRSGPFKSYPETMRRLTAEGHTVETGGWRHRMLSWHWDMHSIDGYPEWQIACISAQGYSLPAFVKLAHERGEGAIESHEIAVAWDNVASVDFYQRDWTDDGIPFVRKGETYWSCWWFATLAERDRFVEWYAALRTPDGPV